MTKSNGVEKQKKDSAGEAVIEYRHVEEYATKKSEEIIKEKADGIAREIEKIAKEKRKDDEGEKGKDHGTTKASESDRTKEKTREKDNPQVKDSKIADEKPNGNKQVDRKLKKECNPPPKDFFIESKSERLNVHSNVIRRLCPEAFLQAKDNVLDVDDVFVWKWIIAFLYTGILPDTEIMTHPKLAIACHQYKITDLLKECRRSMKETLTVNNFSELKKVALQHHAIFPDLKEQMATFCSTLSKEDIIKLLF